MTTRATNVLSRFPAHLEAAKPGKRLGEVTQALALDLDTLSTALARVRRARRLLDSDELRDLLKIAALHGISSAELAILMTRFDRTHKLTQDATASAAAAEQLIGLWGIADAPPRLARYASVDLLTAAAQRASTHDVLLQGVRKRIGAICDNHAQGNGTVRALANGAANALDLDITSIKHSLDRYLHTATVEDRLRLTFPATTGATTAQQPFQPADEQLVLEENPLALAKTGDTGRKHSELFSVLRRGFEEATLQVLVTGVENRTVGPMLVNRDEGQGVGFSGSVPANKTLTFTEEGRVQLDGADVTSLAYAWRGACFADATALRPTDFVFADAGAPRPNDAHFAQAFPAGALSSHFVFPHAGVSLPMPGIRIGETRFAFFVQQAHFSGAELVEPRPSLGLFDASVVGPKGQTAAIVSLQWHERTAFWVNVWIPRRFLALTPDDDQGRETLGRVAQAVNRFRPAGVQVDIKFLDNRWMLGKGTVLVDGSQAADQTGPGAGTELWTAPN